MSKKHHCALSIIVPVFNCEEYIDRCLDSIVNQSFKNFELLIIDDASTDCSYDKINPYLRKYKNLKYIKLEENAGVGNARNIGMQLAKGDYIGFIDSDDWIDSNFYMQTIKSIVMAGAEIAIAGIKTEHGNSYASEIRYQYQYENKVSGKFALTLLSRSISQDCPVSPVVWNKVYRKSYLDDIGLKFITGTQNEDDIFTFFALLHSTFIVLVPDVYYHYYQRNTSLTHSFSKKTITDLIDAFSEIASILHKERLYETYNTEYFAFFEKCVSSILRSLFSCEQNAKIQKQYILFFLEECAKKLPLWEYFEYFDIQRIKTAF